MQKASKLLEEHKRKLSRKAELARNARRRKRKRIDELEARVEQLEEQLRQEQYKRIRAENALALGGRDPRIDDLLEVLSRAQQICERLK